MTNWDVASESLFDKCMVAGPAKKEGASHFHSARPSVDLVLFKTPHTPNPQSVVLVVVVLVAIVEVLVPRVVRIVLSRAPVVRRREAANHNE